MRLTGIFGFVIVVAVLGAGPGAWGQDWSTAEMGNRPSVVRATTFESSGCVLTCPGGMIEGEPQLVSNYTDRFNGGCNSPGTIPKITILHGDAQGNLSFCGVSGFYGGEAEVRDTDWFAITLGETGEVTWTLDAEQRTLGYLLELECPSPGVYGVAICGPCSPGGMVITGEPGQSVGLWVAPIVYTPPPDMIGSEYSYQFTLSGLSPHQAVATEPVSWGTLKIRYR